MTTYYTDATNGDDSNNGTSQLTPWETLAKLKNFGFVADDKIFLKRGEEWVEPLEFTDDGTGEGDRIIIDAYGTGPMPLISYEYLSWPVVLLDGDWVLMRNIHIGTGNNYGVRIRGEHTNVDYCEVEDTGLGIGMEAANGRVRYNHIHDLKVVESGEGGPEDYGGNGIVFRAADCEAGYNFLRNCFCITEEFGLSGGAFELTGAVDNANIHHNEAIDCMDFYEAGANAGEAMANVAIRDNKIIDCKRIGGVHLDGVYGCSISNFKVERNIIVDTDPDTVHAMLWFWTHGALPDAGDFIFRRNIVVAQSGDERPFIGWGNDGIENPSFDLSDNFFIVDGITHIPVDFTGARIMGAHLQLLGF